MAPSKLIVVHNKQMVVKATNYQLITGNLYKLWENGILRHCVLEHEQSMILEEAYNGIVVGHTDHTERGGESM
jgi:hypothetical protein